MKKKILSSFVCVCMVLAVMPNAVFAARQKRKVLKDGTVKIYEWMKCYEMSILPSNKPFYKWMLVEIIKPKTSLDILADLAYEEYLRMQEEKK